MCVGYLLMSFVWVSKCYGEHKSFIGYNKFYIATGQSHALHISVHLCTYMINYVSRYDQRQKLGVYIQLHNTVHTYSVLFLSCGNQLYKHYKHMSAFSVHLPLPSWTRES